MQWTERLTSALNYLEEHLEKSIDMEQAASLANCSLFHFCRMFEVVAGMPPGEYVRRRRLSKAAIELAAGKQRVIDLAICYGYESSEAFSKAFKRCFGISPSEARKPGVTLEIWPPLEVTIIMKGDTSMKYRIEELQAFVVCGKTIRTTSDGGANNRDIPTMWSDLNASGEGPAMYHLAGPLGVLGLCYDYDPASNTFAYMAGIEEPEGGMAVMPTGSEKTIVPAATYAVFTSIGAMPDAIQQTWKKAYSEWFPSSGYEHGGTPDFEVYPYFPEGDPRGIMDGPECETEVWIPIKKKS
jgi:AraC family transcriptional regulator